ncbi:hypothetical protein [Kitasatospora cheerisanensis]|uniref:Uncharacterized protein n=1 Tax=Kitasatospora cheerisanensis KCTC 2395 TaxID=1348663 RepID=A0A066Z3S0_9ACTN|nr:hypothetical protein [Kitasatospora cheerisanensis]KDN84800.1 hypothetical protein KCH_33270 [Kitasatospora cheerisanensis KCTC 2395]
MGSRIAAAAGPQYGWADSPLWTQSVLPTLVLVLLLRLVTAAAVRRSQHGCRARLLGRDRLAQVHSLFAGDAVRRRQEVRALRAAYPPRWTASAVELVLPALLGGALTVLMWVSMHRHFDGQDALDQQMVRVTPPWVAAHGLLALFGGEGGPGAALTGSVLTALWQLLWVRTRVLVLRTGMPAGSWERSWLRRRLLPVLAAQFLAMTLVLPNAALIALVVWQLCSLLAARGLRRLPAVAAAAPVAPPAAAAPGFAAGPTVAAAPAPAPCRRRAAPCSTPAGRRRWRPGRCRPGRPPRSGRTGCSG